MSTDLYRVKYEPIFSITKEEERFIRRYFPKADAITFYINGAELEEIVADAEDNGEEIPKELVENLRDEIKDGAELYFNIMEEKETYPSDMVDVNIRRKVKCKDCVFYPRACKSYDETIHDCLDFIKKRRKENADE